LTRWRALHDFETLDRGRTDARIIRKIGSVSSPKSRAS